MTLEQEQLEWIVQEVLRRLGQQSRSAASTLLDYNNLHLNERLITTHTLHGRLSNVRQLTVSARTVITPAAKDLLRDRQVELVRCD